MIHSSGQVHTGLVRPCAAGGVYGDTADFSAFPIRDCAQKADPLANAPLPIPGACDYNQKIQVLPKQGATFNPGVYCNDIEIRPNAEGETANSPIVFNPGVYIFKGGEFHINNNNEIEGHNVLFHFTEGASWIVESNVEADLTGLQSGAYAGLVVSRSRTDPGGEFDIRANTDFDLEGVVYLPRSTLGIGADTHLSINAPWVAFIVKGFRQYANSDIHLNIDFNLSNMPYPPELEQMFTTLVR